MRKFLRSTGPAALGFAVLGSIALGAASAHAAPKHKLVLSGYADGPEGSNLLTGRYDAVIRRLADHGAAFAGDEVSASTNLCVAYVMTRRLEAAQPACDEALRAAQLDETEPTIFARQRHDEEVAVAYSNRAILKTIEGQTASAVDDMAKARALNTTVAALTPDLDL